MGCGSSKAGQASAPQKKGNAKDTNMNFKAEVEFTKETKNEIEIGTYQMSVNDAFLSDGENALALPLKVDYGSKVHVQINGISGLKEDDNKMVNLGLFFSL